MPHHRQPAGCLEQSCGNLVPWPEHLGDLVVGHSSALLCRSRAVKAACLPPRTPKHRHRHCATPVKSRIHGLRSWEARRLLTDRPPPKVSSGGHKVWAP
ncbi:hypothetical protein NDU88_001973 [Pleurodeles waltl]|uniref:Uncharacterized protein n=1 Tax=Pleurodeles waltl TaxID=8319 RepID=A0AAV7M2N2_PLEWA|nr:hypothetical protein NDU88_001973 [Pleurodeles waltl]